MSRLICGLKARSEVIDNRLVITFFLPQRKVLLNELDNRLGVAECFLVDLVNLIERVGERLLSKLASVLVVAHDLVVKDGEVQGEAESDRVARVKALG